MKIKEKAWEECLALWKRLSEMPTQDTDDDEETFKQNVLEELGIKSDINGCPFCRQYFTRGCQRCPLNQRHDDDLGCFNTPFKTWGRSLSDEGKHYQSKAKKFYNYLLKLKEEQ